MPGMTLRLAQAAGDRPYHAALVPLRSTGDLSRPHTHADYYEMFYVTAGAGGQFVADTWQELRAGDLVLIRRHDRHAFDGARPGGLQFINVAFPATVWHDFLRLTGSAGAARWESQRLPPRSRLDGDALARAELVFRRTVERFDDDPHQLDLIRFLTEAVALLESGERPDRPPDRPAWLSEACRTMREEANLRAGLPRLLELTAVSHGYLARCMRRYYRTTPIGFLTDLRVRRATTLLVSTDLPVTTIAQRCGFASQSYFSRRFRRARGVAPQQFREQSRRAVLP